MTTSAALPFSITQEKGYALIKLHGRCGIESIKAFDAQMEQAVLASPKNVIVNCERLIELSQVWIRSLLQVAKKLDESEKKLRFYGASAEVTGFIKRIGVEGSFQFRPSLRAALTELGAAPPPKLDVNFINPFLDSALKVLQIQASTTAKPGQVYRKAPDDKLSGDISGVIGIVSDTFKGSVVISFPSEVFLKIMSRMLGEELTQLTQEVQDGAGELINIIFGQAKLALNERGYGIQAAIPSVVSGKDHSVQAFGRGPRVVIPFEADAGAFFIEICLSETDQVA